MNDDDEEMYTKQEAPRSLLIKMIHKATVGLSTEEKRAMILFLDPRTSMDLVEGMLNGAFGSELQKEVTIKGMKALPRILGHIVIGDSEQTCMCPVTKLSNDALLRVIEVQWGIIDDLYEHRQRL